MKRDALTDMEAVAEVKLLDHVPVGFSDLAATAIRQAFEGGTYVRVLWSIAGVSLAVGMVLAILYGSRQYLTMSWLDIPHMRAIHGTANALGFALCGLVSQYSASAPQGPKSLLPLLSNRVKLQGFIVSDHPERWPVALKHLGEQLAAGKLQHRETIAQGLESAPRAFIGMLKGENLGKQLVKLI